MSDLGIVVLLNSGGVADVVALRPTKPLVAFTVAAQSIRSDKAAAIGIAVTGVHFTVVVVFMAGEGDFARVPSVLVGMWVAITLVLHGLLHARKLRMDRDDVYAAHLALRATTPQPIRRVVREVMPGPQIFDTEPQISNWKRPHTPGPEVMPGHGCFTVRFLCSFLPRSWS